MSVLARGGKWFLGKCSAYIKYETGSLKTPNCSFPMLSFRRGVRGSEADQAGDMGVATAPRCQGKPEDNRRLQNCESAPGLPD